MDAIHAIMTRRSVRHFKPDPIPEELVEQLLHAAMQAPSAHNGQPWHFVVIDQREILDAIPTHHPYAAMCKEAPLAILVCGDTDLARTADSWLLDCSAATQNILLAAHALGLGAVWVHMLWPESAAPLRERLGLPEHVRTLALVPVGYAVDPLPVKDRYRPERVQRNHWKDNA